MTTLINPKQIEGWDEMLSNLKSVQEVLNGTENKVEDVEGKLDEIKKKKNNEF